MGDRSRLRVVGSGDDDPRATRTTPEYWRSLAERLGPGGLEIDGEFPPGLDAPPDAVSRRRFLAYAGASMALAGLSACKVRRAERILPYSRQPPEITPGIPLRYATSFVIGGYATGIIVESHEGRPTKIEGNPDHPASLGASGVFEQASLLQLYDPSRAKSIREASVPRSWVALGDALGATFDGANRNPRSHDDGAGLHFLLEPTSSPIVADLIQRIRARYPRAAFHFHDPLHGGGAIDAARSTFGHPLVPQLDLARAEVIASLDADFLSEGPLHLRYARQFAAGRRVRSVRDDMNRLYVVETNFSPTGASADHRLAVRGSEVVEVMGAIAAEVLASKSSASGLASSISDAIARWRGAHAELTKPVARDLLRHAGRSVVIAGDRQPAITHALAHVVNHALGNVGRDRPVTFTSPALFEAGEASHDLAPLVRALERGEVERLVILGGNPAYTAPADLELPRRIQGVARTVYLGLYENETARACRWFVPEKHYLESWGDARAYDGTVSFVQPLIEPLYGGKTVAEVLAAFLGETGGPRDLLVGFWRSVETDETRFPTSLTKQVGFGASEAKDATPSISGIAPPETPANWTSSPIFDEAFASALKRGLVVGTALAPKEVEPVIDGASLVHLLELAAISGLARRRTPELEGHAVPRPVHARDTDADHDSDLEIAFYADPRVRDGSFTNNPWLLELPSPLTKLTWGNAAVVSPRTAHALEIESGEPVRLEHRGRMIEAPALILPGHADGVVSIALGYGREGAETNARGVGVNAYVLRTSSAPYFALGLSVTRRGSLGPDSAHARARALAITQIHWGIEGRPVALAATLESYRADPARWRELNTDPPSMRARWPTDGQQWGMSIDLGVCTGCSACAIACQAENNVPVVGKLNVQKSREMHWLRIDRYFTGAIESPEVVMQPMACQHCENAPCEYVCPVNATVHSQDGLNEMVYNRCVGTRFCSNNCPYKVRRFNWFDFNREKTPLEQMASNPEVTVRERGVMEKCTYCVQRIRKAGIRARVEGREVTARRLGEPEEVLETACQQACPTRAIVFGDINDAGAEVTRMRENERAYAVLNETGSRPRTRYLVKLRNLNPEMPPGAAS